MGHIAIGGAIVAVGAFIARLKAILAWLGQKWTSIAPVALPLILEAEKMAADGTIDRADRKKLVMESLAAAQAKGLFKLNWIEKILLPLAVDRISESLPDITMNKQAQDIIKEVISKQEGAKA